MNVKVLPVAMLVLLMGWMTTNVARPAKAATKHAGATNPASTKVEPTEQHPYLGVGIEPLHPSMASHLPDMLIKGQGVLVSYVTADSPASKAGIKQDDILARYDDQKLFSAEQLAKLVMADKPGHDVAIELVRGGKLQTVHATLDVRTDNATAQHPPHHWWSEFSWPWSHRHQVMQQMTDDTAKSNDWESFDSLTLKRLDDGKFQAEIKYLNDQGKMEHHVFKGTRDEIEQAVNNESDLPDGERDHLLNAIEHPRHAWVLPEFARPGDIDFYWQPFPSDL